MGEDVEVAGSVSNDLLVSKTGNPGELALSSVVIDLANIGKLKGLPKGGDGQLVDV